MLNSKIYKTEIVKSHPGFTGTSGKKNYLLILLVFTCLIGNAQAQAPDWLWAKGMGGTDDDHVGSIAIDALGNVYTTGYFYGTVDFDPDSAGSFNLTSTGYSDIFISKLDSSGNFIWAKSMGEPFYDFGVSIAIDLSGSGDIYTTGSFVGTADFDPGAGTFNLTSAGNLDIFISKLDASGNFVWAKRMGGTDFDEGRFLALDPAGSGDVYTTGVFNGSADFDPGAGTYNLTSSGFYDIFISKLDASGNFVWAKGIGGTGDDQSFSVALDPAGNGDVYTTGQFRGTVDFDPGTGVFNLIQSTGNSDIFISKLDGSGNFVWAKAMSASGGGGSGHSIAINTAGSGDVYTTGFFAGTVDFDPGAGTFNLTGGSIFISKLDSSGNFVWAKAMGGTGSTNGYSIALDPAGSGDVYTTGVFYGTVDFDPDLSGSFNITADSADIFVSKLNSSGNFVWAKAIGGTHDDYGYSITLDASGKVHVAGEFESPFISSGSSTLTNAGVGTTDIFIAKLDNAITGTESVENNNGISVFPNPAPGTFTFQSTIQQVNHSTITITNTLGEKVYEQKIISEKTEINLNHQSSGIYFLNIKTEKNSTTQKLIIQK